MVQMMTVENLSIITDPEIMGGTPVFAGTRVPIQTLFDYLMDGCTLDEFLDNFPTVTREVALHLLAHAASHVTSGASPK
jgi:uncharacterized protein (DUF433 family)